MKFCWCTIRVNDMEESLAFYQEIVGMPLMRRFKEGEVEIAFLGDGETKVELLSHGGEKVCIGQDISIGFEVESLDDMMDFVQKKGLEVTGPFSPTPHIRFFFVNDPNGLKIQFEENME